MKSKFNKKKINFFPNRKIIKHLFFLFFFIFFLILIFDGIKKHNLFYVLIQDISNKFNYQLDSYELNKLNRVNKGKVLKIIKNYYHKSIFLLPLKELEKKITNLEWVKRVNISTNLKNKIYVEIIEYQPLGLYIYNNKLFFFSDEGIILDKYSNNSIEQFIIFHGKDVLKNANNFLNILNNIKGIEYIKIKEAYYINGRRWDIKLDNDLLLNLSEKNIEESIKNYIKLVEKFNESVFSSINKIDLRNNEKAIISFK
tara:strand:+ start:22938 stop:23705 length:768 start_codon:yes stop_codon:yes gene_type:complete